MLAVCWHLQPLVHWQLKKPQNNRPLSNTSPPPVLLLRMLMHIIIHYPPRVGVSSVFKCHFWTGLRRINQTYRLFFTGLISCRCSHEVVQVRPGLPVAQK